VSGRPAGAPRPRGRLPRFLAALRVSAFERNIALALVVAAVLPSAGALWLAGQLADVSVALDPRVVDRLEAMPALYGDLFQARKQLYAEQARAIARGLPRTAEAGPAYLDDALARTPRLRRLTWADRTGAVVAEREAQGPGPDGEWREAPAVVSLPGGGRLEAVFAIEARYFAELNETRELAELVQGLDALRAEIRRSYLRAYAGLLVVWVLLTATLGIALARRTTRRVSDLVLAVQRLAAGDLSVQVDPGRARDEVAGLARAFNAMVREVRESRDRIVYLEKISGWQEVARRLAHEIKNPLTPMKLAFQQLEARWKTAPERDPEFGRLLADVGEIVREEIGTLQRLVDEFSGFAKLPEVRPEPADLVDFVEEFVRTSPQLAEEADLDVAREGGPSPVALDRALMRRVLANLCANAVEAARPARARIHLGVARGPTRALLTVADEGPGVERGLRDRIFDPYFTTKGTGTGLGLAIVKKIVLQHGGEIQAGEREGGGAAFTVSLPVRDAGPGAPDPSPTAGPEGGYNPAP